jgi:thioredoxin-like negative regulator of GroEL
VRAVPALAPVIDALARAYVGRVRVAKLNVHENPGVAARYAFQWIPTLLLFDSGHLRDRLVGAQPHATLQARLESLWLEPLARRSVRLRRPTWGSGGRAGSPHIR